MKLALRSTILIFFLLLFVGCSQDGDIKVVNNCNTTLTGLVDNDPVKLQPGESYTKNIYIGKKLGLIGPDEFEIEISGTAWTKKSFKTKVVVKSGQTTTYSVKDDIGALKLNNTYIKDIIELRLKKCDETEYGESYATENKPIKPGNFFLKQLDEGCYDIFLKYGSEAIEDSVKGLNISIGVVTEVNWTVGETPPTK